MRTTPERLGKSSCVTWALGGPVELAISVNVIEHVLSPHAFLQSLRAAVRDGGHVVVICPDGDVPNYELLFYDHLYSFGSNALLALASAVGLVGIRIEKA